MSYNIFAFLNRMKYINRWPLMRNTEKENLQEHSLQVAMFAHALCVITNRFFGGNVNPERAATLALFHDASETITSDLPTPIKYYNDEILNAFKKIEGNACNTLLGMVPDDLKAIYEDIFKQNGSESEEWKRVKAADKIAAYTKCLEELRAGNKEFSKAAESLKQIIDKLEMPEVNFFVINFLPAFECTLDEL